MIQLFRELGEWDERDNRTPEPGDVIFYDWDDSGIGDNTGWPDHVGFVERVNGGNIVVIEGNYSDSVKRRTLAVNGKYIRGYGVPKYDRAQEPEQATQGSKTVEEVAKEVIAGAWGSGDDRKNRLSAAGYDYFQVQTAVNALLAGKETATKSVDEVAREVIAGKWGNDPERKKALETAGYNYSDIQKRVNTLLR